MTEARRFYAPRFVQPEEDPVDEDLRALRDLAERQVTQLDMLNATNGALARASKQFRLFVLISLAVQAAVITGLHVVLD